MAHSGLSMLLFLFMISSVFYLGICRTDSPDVSALNVLFNSLNKPSQLSGWQSSGGDPCDDNWDGITCSGSSVTEIKLSDRGLSGSLGYQLSSLTSVTTFDLSKNNLQSDIPYQLPPNTVRIDLSGNSFSGGVPYSISQMSDLEYLNLAKNKLSGQLSDMFGKLPKLSELDLSFNHFSGNLPQSLGSLKSLRTLNLANNQFSGSINVLGKLPLEDLNVQNNKFTGAVPAQLKDINSLQIDGTRLAGASSTGGGSGGGKAVAGVAIAGIVIAVLFAIVLVLALLQKKKSSSTASLYLDDQSTRKRSFTPLVDNGCEDQAVGSVNMNAMDFKPKPSDYQKQVSENEFTMNYNSKLNTERVPAKEYSFLDLQAATGSFSSSRVLGNGSIGSVYKAKYADGKVLAVKKIDSNLPSNSTVDFMDIVSAIDRLHHQNVAELVGFCYESGNQLMVYDYEMNGSLHEYLHLSDDYSKPLSWETRVKIALGTARAIEYLHETCSPSLVHKNIKSANILLDFELNPRLSDCGLAPYYYQGNNLGPGYTAPESTKSSEYTAKTDIYCFGVVMLELLTGRMPYDSSKPRTDQNLVAWAKPRLHDNDALAQMADPALRGLYLPKSLSRFADVISQCVQPEPGFRPAISEVVQSLALCTPRTGKFGESLGASRRSSTDSDYGYY